MAFELLISLPHALILKEIWIVLHSVLHRGAFYISVKLLHQLLCVVLVLILSLLQLVLHLLGQTVQVCLNISSILILPSKFINKDSI